MKMEKIVIYIPKFGYATGEMPHIKKPMDNYMPGQNVYYLYTVCKNIGKDVKVFDGNWHVNPTESILNENPDKILITTTTPCFENTLDMVKQLFSSGYYGKIYIGGPHVNLNYHERDFLLPKIDNVIYLPIKNSNSTFEWVMSVFKEHSIFEILDCYSFGELSKYIENNLNKQINKLEMDEIDYKKYIFCFFKPSLKWIKETYQERHIMKSMKSIPIRASLITTIGCNNDCSFCGNPYIYQIVYKNIEIVRAMLIDLKKNNFNKIVFHDMNFFMSLKHADSILDMVEELQLSFSIQTCLENLNKTILKKLKKAGVRKILVGIENPSSYTVDKNIQLEGILDILDYSKKIGISGIKLSYIVGLPGVALEKDIELIKHILIDIKKRDHELSNLQVNLYTPYRAEQSIKYVPFDKNDFFDKENNSTIFILNNIGFRFWGFFPVGIKSKEHFLNQVYLCDTIYYNIYSQFQLSYLEARSDYCNAIMENYPELSKFINSYETNINLFLSNELTLVSI